MRSDEAIPGSWQIFTSARRRSAERAGLRRRVALGRCYSTRVTERLTLDVRQLSACSRLSPGVCAYLSEAASVVLASFHVPPPPPTPAAVFRGEARHDAVLLWEAPDAVQQSSHANELEVVRDGACAIAVAAVYAEGGYLVRKRPRHGSGADYLMTRVGDDADNFVRLEVSGTARGDAVELRARLAQKRVQLREGRDPAPGIAVVVAFKDAIVRMEDA